jgi:hypothetical protein
MGLLEETQGSFMQMHHGRRVQVDQSCRMQPWRSRLEAPTPEPVLSHNDLIVYRRCIFNITRSNLARPIGSRRTGFYLPNRYTWSNLHRWPPIRRYPALLLPWHRRGRRKRSPRRCTRQRTPNPRLDAPIPQLNTVIDPGLAERELGLHLVPK